MISLKAVKFISGAMKIDFNSIENKFNEIKLSSDRKGLEAALEEFVYFVENENLKSAEDIYFVEESRAENLINKYFSDCYHRFCDEEAIIVLESLRYDFCSFAYGGLHQLYTRQNNQHWHAKVIIYEELRPNDIGSLPDSVEIFRGTDMAEFESKNYGQSWTTDQSVAYEFAFRHYAYQPWFKKDRRVVLRAKLSRSKIYFYRSGDEFEVVIDNSKVTDVLRLEFL